MADEKRNEPKDLTPCVTLVVTAPIWPACSSVGVPGCVPGFESAPSVALIGAGHGGVGETIRRIVQGVTGGWVVAMCVVGK